MSGSRAGTRSKGWIAAAACATAAACSSELPPRSAATPPSQGDPVVPCLLERRPLTLADGTQVYVEHEQVIQVGEELLLAGSPSFHWKPRPGRAAERLSSDSLVAVYLGEPARTVANPVPGTLGSIRVAALDDRRWAAIMLQVDPDSLPGVEAFRGLWYGEHDGDGWTLVEPMEFPGARINSRLSSRLVTVGDRLVWLAWEPEGSRTLVHEYERVDGTWTRRELAGEDRVEQMDLAYLEGAGLWMLLSGYDAGLPGFQKSLRLFRERPGAVATSPDRWEFVSRVTVAEPDVRLRWASLAVQTTGVTVTWNSVGRGASPAMARVGITPDAPGTLVTLADGVYFARSAPMPSGSLTWLAYLYPSATPTAEVALFTYANGGIGRLAAFVSPFTGTFQARPVGDVEVLVVGAEMGSDSIDVPVRSLILRLTTSC